MSTLLFKCWANSITNVSAKFHCGSNLTLTVFWGKDLTDAGPAICVHAESFAAFAVIRTCCVDARLLASSIELLTLIYI